MTSVETGCAPTSSRRRASAQACTHMHSHAHRHTRRCWCTRVRHERHVSRIGVCRTLPAGAGRRTSMASATFFFRSYRLSDSAKRAPPSCRTAVMPQCKAAVQHTHARALTPAALLHRTGTVARAVQRQRNPRYRSGRGEPNPAQLWQWLLLRDVAGGEPSPGADMVCRGRRRRTSLAMVVTSAAAAAWLIARSNARTLRAGYSTL